MFAKYRSSRIGARLLLPRCTCLARVSAFFVGRLAWQERSPVPPSSSTRLPELNPSATRQPVLYATERERAIGARVLRYNKAHPFPTRAFLPSRRYLPTLILSVYVVCNRFFLSLPILHLVCSCSLFSSPASHSSIRRVEEINKLSSATRSAVCVCSSTLTSLSLFDLLSYTASALLTFVLFLCTCVFVALFFLVDHLISSIRASRSSRHITILPARRSMQ